jgi:hypothetical protein
MNSKVTIATAYETNQTRTKFTIFILPQINKNNKKKKIFWGGCLFGRGLRKSES